MTSFQQSLFFSVDFCLFPSVHFQRNTRQWCNTPSLSIGNLLSPPPPPSAFQGMKGVHAACAQFMASIVHPSLGMFSRHGTLQPSQCNSLAGEWTQSVQDDSFTEINISFGLSKLCYVYKLQCINTLLISSKPILMRQRWKWYVFQHKCKGLISPKASVLYLHGKK